MLTHIYDKKQENKNASSTHYSETHVRKKLNNNHVEGKIKPKHIEQMQINCHIPDLVQKFLFRK